MSSSSQENLPPLPATAYDDLDFTGENPYWAVVRELPHDDLFGSWGGRDAFMPESYPHFRHHGGTVDIEEFRALYEKQPNRQNLVRDFAFAIPAPRAIRWLVDVLDGRPVVEIGAGTGYWAWMLTQYGVTVDAYDEAPPATEHNGYFTPRTEEDRLTGQKGKQWFPVKKARESILKRAKYRDWVLFLCWPPYSDSMGLDTIQAFQGDTLILIGEGREGCTGSDEMFDLLESEWELVDECPFFVQWSGIHDYLEVWRRKEDA